MTTISHSTSPELEILAHNELKLFDEDLFESIIINYQLIID